MTRVGLLVCGQAPTTVTDRHGPYQQWFEALLHPHGITLERWDVEGGAIPPSPHSAEAWLITGSPHGVYEAHGFIRPLEAFVRDVVAEGVPMVGICFGHQIIAQAMGGRVEKFAGGWAFGRRAYRLDGLGLVHLNACHQDQVITAPASAEVIATNDFCAIAGLRIGTTCWTLQPHPEINASVLEAYIAHYQTRQTIPAHLVAQALDDIAMATDEPSIGIWMSERLKGRSGADQPLAASFA